jgi:hypothetical protein
MSNRLEKDQTSVSVSVEALVRSMRQTRGYVECGGRASRTSGDTALAYSILAGEGDRCSRFSRSQCVVVASLAAALHIAAGSSTGFPCASVVQLPFSV